MRKTIYVTILVLIIILSNGCTSEILDTNALLKPPKISNKYIEIRNVLDTIYESYTFVTPQNGHNNNAVYIKDLYNDPLKEAVIFLRENETYEIKVIILDKDDNEQWVLKEIFDGSGYDINRIDFNDLDGDGLNDIIISWQGSTLVDRGLSVYTLKDDQFINVFNTNYTAYIMEDFDNNSNQELLVLNLDKAKGQASAALYDLDIDTKSMYYVDQVRMDGFVNNYYSLTSGYVDQDKRGVYIDVSIGAHSSYTDLIIMRNGSLRNVFYNEKWEYTDLTYRPFSIPSQDIDGDGILEVPLLRVPKGYEDTVPVEIPYITVWMEWNGLSGLRFDYEVYMDSENNFRFTFPREWKNKSTLIRENNHYKFSYYSITTKKNYKIFDVMVVNREEYYDNRSDYPDFELLETQLNRVYLLKLFNTEIPNERNIDAEYIKKNFKLIN